MIRVFRMLSLVAFVGTTSVGCQEGTAPSPAATEHASLYSKAGLRQALLSFETRLGTPIQALSLRLLPGRALLQAEAPSRNGADQFEYVDGHLLGPTPVTLRGSGTLKENLFPLGDANVEKLPALIEEALRVAQADEVTQVTIRRGLPETSSPRFILKLSIDGTERTLVANSDGVLLGGLQ